MTQDKLYRSGTVHEDFTFNAAVADVFDDMLHRSVPFYEAVIDSIAEILRDHLPQDSTVYDLGCSTGTTLIELARRLQPTSFHLVGIDNAPAMLDKARRKAERFRTTGHIRFIEDDITACPLPGAGAIICNYTLQFIRPMLRPDFVRRLFAALPDNGILVLSEKIICRSTLLNRRFIEFYHRFKRRQGYSELEIAAKREALENVLIPFSLDENLALLDEAGFHDVEPFFQWFNFVSLVAIKRV